MKKVFLVMVFMGLLISCSLDDDSIDFRFVSVPIEDAILPDTLILGNTYEFPIQYLRPSDCHFFEGFDYPGPQSSTDSLRYVGVVNRVFDSGDCTDFTNEMVERNLGPFEVLYTYHYVFKFYQGRDSNDEPIYLTKVVPVKTQ